MPSLTNVGELAPPELIIPTILITQSIVVEYVEEYIIVERVDSTVRYVVPSLWCQ